MEKFKFRLDRVLDVKVIHEKEKQRAWILARRERENRQREEQELKQQQQQFGSDRQKTASVGEMRIEAELSGGIRFKLRKQAVKVAQATMFEEQTNRNLMIAMQERKVLENLKEKRRGEHLIEENRFDQKHIDEIASRRYIDTLHKGQQ